MGQKALAVFRKRIARGLRFVEQYGVQGLFEQMNAPRNGGVLHPQPLSGATDPLSARNLKEIADSVPVHDVRSEEHTSELQSRENLVCRLLLEKKNTKHNSSKL